LKAIHKEEEILAKISDTLNTSVEKLATATERLVTEWKEARRERDRLTKELIARDIGAAGPSEASNVKQIDDLKFLAQEFEPLDVNRMIKTASERVKNDPKMVAVFYGKDEKTARIVVMVGKDAAGKGVDARLLADEAASTLGGAGSGRQEFAQGGGTATDKLSEAIGKAEKAMRRQLKAEK
jgi:alanyl-tRNA synthetase